MDYRGRRALVMGLGVHGGGVGVARFLAERGAQVTVTDLSPAEQLTASLDDLADLPVTYPCGTDGGRGGAARDGQIAYVLGRHREEDFRSADLVVRNPAVPAPFALLAGGDGGWRAGGHGDDALLRGVSEPEHHRHNGHQGQDHDHAAARRSASGARLAARCRRQSAPLGARNAATHRAGKLGCAGAVELATGGANSVAA